MDSVAHRGHQSQSHKHSTVRAHSHESPNPTNTLSPPALGSFAPQAYLTHILTTNPLPAFAQLYRLGRGRLDDIRFKSTQNPIIRSPKEYNPRATVQMDPGIIAGASGGFGGGPR